jgi:hypothetical protein
MRYITGTTEAAYLSLKKYRVQNGVLQTQIDNFFISNKESFVQFVALFCSTLKEDTILGDFFKSVADLEREELGRTHYQNSRFYKIKDFHETSIALYNTITSINRRVDQRSNYHLESASINSFIPDILTETAKDFFEYIKFLYLKKYHSGYTMIELMKTEYIDYYYDKEFNPVRFLDHEKLIAKFSECVLDNRHTYLDHLDSRKIKRVLEQSNHVDFCYRFSSLLTSLALDFLVFNFKAKESFKIEINTKIFY